MTAISASPNHADRSVANGTAKWVPLVGIVLSVIAIRATAFGDPVSSMDEQLYALIGSGMTQGSWPFVDLWDRKPWGLFALFAMADLLDGPATLASPLSYQLLGTAFTMAGALLVYRLACAQTNRTTAAGAAMLYPLLMALYGSESGQSEVFHVPLMLAMLWLLHDPAQFAARRQALIRAGLAMLLGGIALQIKYTVVPQCVLFGVFALWRLRPFMRGPMDYSRTAAWLLLTGLIPTAMVASGYTLAGEWQAFAHANFLSFFDRAAGGRFDAKIMVAILPLAVLIGGGWYAAARLRAPPNAPLYGLFAAFTIASLLVVALPGTTYMYYLAALVPGALLCALPLIDTRGMFRAVPLMAVAAILALLFNPVQRIERSLDHRAGFARLTATIAPLVDGESECLWILDGPTALYRSTGSCLPTKFIYPDHLNNALEVTALGISQTGEVARILAHEPPVIVTADEPVTRQNEAVLQRVDDALARNYRRVGSETIWDREIIVWRRAER